MTGIAQRRLLPLSHGTDARIHLGPPRLRLPVPIRLTASTRTTAHLLLSSSGLQPRSRAPSGALIRTWWGSRWWMKQFATRLCSAASLRQTATLAPFASTTP